MYRMLFLLTTITPYGYWDNGKPFSAPGISLVPALAGVLCPSCFLAVLDLLFLLLVLYDWHAYLAILFYHLAAHLNGLPICWHTLLLFHLTSVLSRYHHSYHWGKNFISGAYILPRNIKCMGPYVWNGTGRSLILSHQVGAMLDMNWSKPSGEDQNIGTCYLQTIKDSNLKTLRKLRPDSKPKRVKGNEEINIFDNISVLL